MWSKATAAAFQQPVPTLYSFLCSGVIDVLTTGIKLDGGAYRAENQCFFTTCQVAALALAEPQHLQRVKHAGWWDTCVGTTVLPHPRERSSDLKCTEHMGPP